MKPSVHYLQNFSPLVHMRLHFLFFFTFLVVGSLSAQVVPLAEVVENQARAEAKAKAEAQARAEALIKEQALPEERALVVDPAKDHFDYCKLLCRQANDITNHTLRIEAYKRVIVQLENYRGRFPNDNTQAALYYLGECYYHSGSVNKGKQILDSVVKRYGKGVYVLQAANRLARDLVSKTEISQNDYVKAARYFGHVADNSTTPEQRYRSRYQQASCFLYAGYKESAMKSFVAITQAEGIQPNYRDGANLQLGKLHFDNKNMKRALEYFEPLMLEGVGPASKSEATFYAGRASMELGDNEAATTYFKAALLAKDNKFKASAQTALVSILYKDGKYDEVLAVMKTGSFRGTEAMELEKYWLAGQSAYKLQRYQVAIGHLARAERQKPLSQKAFDAGYYRLLCFYKIEGTNIPDQVDAFLEVYKERYNKNPRIHIALLTKAETLFEQGQFHKASATYNQINASLVGDKNKANLYYKRGNSLAESGDHNGAVRSFTNLISRFGDDLRIPAAIARRGLSFRAVGDRSSALSDFDLLIAKYPNDQLASVALQNSAEIKKEDKDYPEMIRRYRKLLKEFPSLRAETVANAEYKLGWAEYQLKQYREAVPHFKKAIKLGGENYLNAAGSRLVFSLYLLKDKEALQVVVDDMQSRGKTSVVSASVYCWLGKQCYSQEEWRNSERYLTLGVTPLEPRQTLAAYWKILGSSRIKTEKYKESLDPIKNFLDVEENPFWRAEAYYDQAVAYFKLKEFAKAKNAAESAAALRPAGKLKAEVRIMLGDIAYAGKEYNDAAAFYVVVVQLFEDDLELRPEALYKSYLALSKKGDEKQAAHYLGLLDEEFPDYAKSQ